MSLRFDYCEHRELSVKLRTHGREQGAEWTTGARDASGERDAVMAGINREGQIVVAHSRKKKFHVTAVPSPDGTGRIVEVTVAPGEVLLASRRVGPRADDHYHVYFLSPARKRWGSVNESLDATSATVTCVAPDGSACAGFYTKSDGTGEAIFTLTFADQRVHGTQNPEGTTRCLPLATNGEAIVPFCLVEREVPDGSDASPASGRRFTREVGIGRSMTRQQAWGLGLPLARRPDLRFVCDPEQSYTGGFYGNPPFLVGLGGRDDVVLATHRSFPGQYLIQQFIVNGDAIAAIGTADHGETGLSSILIWPDIRDTETPPLELTELMDGSPENLRASHLLHASDQELLLIGSSSNQWNGFRAFSAIRKA